MEREGFLVGICVRQSHRPYGHRQRWRSDLWLPLGCLLCRSKSKRFRTFLVVTRHHWMDGLDCWRGVVCRIGTLKVMTEKTRYQMIEQIINELQREALFTFRSISYQRAQKIASCARGSCVAGELYADLLLTSTVLVYYYEVHIPAYTYSTYVESTVGPSRLRAGFARRVGSRIWIPVAFFTAAHFARWKLIERPLFTHQGWRCSSWIFYVKRYSRLPIFYLLVYVVPNFFPMLLHTAVTSAVEF